MTAENKSLASQAQGSINPGDKLPMFLKALNSYKDAVAQVAAKSGVGVERILAISTFVVKSNPKLMKCTPESIISAVIMAAMSGLDPNPARGELWFVPYKNQDGTFSVQLQTGYKGEKQLAYRSGLIESIYARAVYEGDQFEHIMGIRESITHKAGANFGDETKVVGAYAVAYLKGSNTPVLEVMNRRQIERIRLKNAEQRPGMYNKLGEPKSAWASDYDMQARKSVFKRLCEKELPSSIEWNEWMYLDGTIAPPLAEFKQDGSGLATIPMNPNYDEIEPTQALPPINTDAQIPAMEKQSEKVEATKAVKGDLSNLAQ
jgi:recombination protein RecT